MLGAAGAIEALFTIKSLSSRQIPPTINLKTRETEFNDLNIIQDKSIDMKSITHPDVSASDQEISGSLSNESENEERDIYALSNSFGFGGINASLLFKTYHNQ